MDDRRLGLICRTLRHRLGWRQIDLATRAGCSQSAISRLERGYGAGLPTSVVRAVFAALDARYDATVFWRGGELDRILDERHAGLVEAAASVYRDAGWEVLPEVSFAHFGERGSIDLLAVNRPASVVAINEIKSEITSIEETIRRHDMKVRLAKTICFERLGWRPRDIAQILVVPEESKGRRVLARHATTFGAAYPSRGHEVRAWVRKPVGALRGIWILSVSPEEIRKNDPVSSQRSRERPAEGGTGN